MNSKFIDEFRSKINLSTEQKEIIVGLILGDGCLETQNEGKTYRLKIEQTSLHRDYVDWLYGKLQNLVLTEPREKIKRIREKTYCNYGFQTISCGSLRFFAHQFYDQNSKKKKIPKIIGRLLSPLALTVWFMDDGQIKSKKHKALMINSQCFSRKDVGLLQEVLLKNFQIETTLRKDKQGFRIYLLSKTIQNFLAVIRSYIIPSMRYKIGRINTVPKK